MHPLISNTNAQLIDHIADMIDSRFEGSIAKVGIDGFCAAGKTTVANELKKRLQDRQRRVISATSDRFMNPAAIRWRQGKESPEGFYQDAIDFEAIERELLSPLSENGNKQYRTSTYDVQKSKADYSELKVAQPGTILIFDGLFLQIPRLSNHWDVMIYVEASYDTCISRAKHRNQENLNSPNEIEQVYRRKYVPGFELYRKEVKPVDNADYLIKTE